MSFVRSNAVSSRPVRAGVLLIASFALIATTFGAHAAPVAAPASTGKSQLVTADSTEFGARKRSRHHRRGGGNAAGLAMMGMMIGTIGTMIAAQQRREAYEASYNRAYAAQYPYGYAQPQPYVYQQPHVHHHRQVYHQPQVYQQPRVLHRPHVHHGHAPAARVINKAMFHR